MPIAIEKECLTLCDAMFQKCAANAQKADTLFQEIERALLVKIIAEELTSVRALTVIM